ncbi:MAG TPA: ATP-binding cassette domain-containing protein [Candidatus Dormibacteraeota bacterium]
MNAVLEVHDLRKTYVQHLLDGARREVLRGVDLNVAPGEVVVLRGESGSGKSSLLRCVYRSAVPDAGSILLAAGDGALDLAQASERQVLEAREDLVGMASQFLSVVPRVSAVELVEGGGVSREEAGELLAKLSLRAELHSVPPATFSGGERQIVNLALALARKRPLLLLDEVTSALDPRRRQAVLAVLKERKERGVAMLAVFHDSTPSGLTDRELRLEAGLVAV